jgi:hypothetical protein
MKSATAYYLLLFYSLAICKPVLPLVSDFLAHSLWQTHHLKTVHHQHGREHVHYELVKAASEEQNENTSLPSKSAEPVSVHIPVNIFQEFSFSSIPIVHNASYLQRLSHPAMDVVFPPPKA